MPLQTISKDDGFVRPDKTYTESLNPAVIKYQLSDYRYLPENNFDDIHLGSNIKYFIKKDGRYLYRIGGTLVNKNEWKTSSYVVLMSAHSKKWCVQLDNAIVFVRMNNQEILKKFKERENKMKKYLHNIKEELYKKEKDKKNAIIPNHLLKNKNFLKIFISKLSTNSLENYKKNIIQFIDTQHIKIFAIVIGYDPKLRQFTPEIEVTGIEKFNDTIIGIRYINHLVTKILPTAPYSFIYLGSYRKKFNTILQTNNIN